MGWEQKVKYEISLDDGVWTVTRAAEPVGRYVTKDEARKSAEVLNAWVEAARALNRAPGIGRNEPLFA